jgi:hypothetical protein
MSWIGHATVEQFVFGPWNVPVDAEHGPGVVMMHDPLERQHAATG